MSIKKQTRILSVTTVYVVGDLKYNNHLLLWPTLHPLLSVSQMLKWSDALKLPRWQLTLRMKWCSLSHQHVISFITLSISVVDRQYPCSVNGKAQRVLSPWSYRTDGMPLLNRKAQRIITERVKSGCGWVWGFSYYQYFQVMNYVLYRSCQWSRMWSCLRRWPAVRASSQIPYWNKTFYIFIWGDRETWLTACHPTPACGSLLKMVMLWRSPDDSLLYGWSGALTQINKW